jgi:predicted  nucleic acid-binding Zn-ribbon protein
MIPNILQLQWLLWSVALVAGLGVIIVLFRLRFAERFLPPWNELKGLDARLPVRHEELRQVSDEIQSRRQQLATLDGEVGHLHQLREWQQANPDAPTRIQQMMVDLERGRSELAAVQQKLAQEEARFIEIGQESQRLTREKTQLAEQIPMLRGQLAGLQQQKADLENNLHDLEGQCRQSEFKLADLQNSVRASEHEFSTLRQQLDTIVREKGAAIAARDQVCISRDAAKADLDLTTKRLESARDELKQLEEKFAGLARERRRLDEEVDSLIRQRDSLAGDCREAKAELDKMRVQLDQAEHEKRAAMTERDQARAERDAACAELTSLQRSIETHKAIAESLRADLAQTPDLARGDYADLFAPVSFPELRPARGSQDERESIERARDYIHGRGLVFPERVLHAFHTALKVSDISPLVVLAGISGTGKSELPRHYADAMGIHFLLVAVQPRWDSPQDLFGFYNYLEKRYKATELARALVQFELFNKATWELPDGAKIDDRSDRMILVLLDEMNLARTEYYFSEFLSKLETRRMVDDEMKHEDRARAEIELDMGSLLHGGKSLRLYPARNVLFVGTMNEDESTQALSDKVIDRASVLRFWRPEKTNPDTAHVQQRKPTNGLTFEIWQRWIRPRTDLGPYASEVDKWIEQLNDALTRIGRPFAFRVDQAIRSYVANYPRWVANWHKRSMADQIEQRIFPKLRGVEPEVGPTLTALRDIGQVIDQIEDERLKSAFRDSWENQLTFLFRGVSRDERE